MTSFKGESRGSAKGCKVPDQLGATVVGNEQLIDVPKKEELKLFLSNDFVVAFVLKFCSKIRILRAQPLMYYLPKIFVRRCDPKMGRNVGTFGKCKGCDKRQATDKDGLCDNCRYAGLLTSLLEERKIAAK